MPDGYDVKMATGKSFQNMKITHHIIQYTEAFHAFHSQQIKMFIFFTVLYLVNMITVHFLK